jgi:hypothetical protein
MTKVRQREQGIRAGRPAHDAVTALAREHATAAIERLVYWLHSDDPDVSIAEAIALLDRGYGRPAHKITGPEGEALIPTVVVHQIVREPVSTDTAESGAYSPSKPPSTH